MANSDIRIKWFINEVSNKITLTMRQRMQIATELIHSRVVQNIKRPVTKSKGPRGGEVITNRSAPGEYPKVDTGLLLKSIISRVVETDKGVVDGFIGTTLGYGAILEYSKKLNRNFLKRTLEENREFVEKILSGPIR